MRAGLRALLEAAGDIQVVGEAENGQHTVQKAKKLLPDVVIVDEAMSMLNGLEATRQIADEAPTVRVLFFSSFSDAQHGTASR